MTVKSQVDSILDDDNNDFENRKFGLICQLARELEDQVAKLKMENKELYEIPSLANSQTNATFDSYNCGTSRIFPPFGR